MSRCLPPIEEYNSCWISFTPGAPLISKLSSASSSLAHHAVGSVMLVPLVLTSVGLGLLVGALVVLGVVFVVGFVVGFSVGLVQWCGG